MVRWLALDTELLLRQVSVASRTIGGVAIITIQFATKQDITNRTEAANLIMSSNNHDIAATTAVDSNQTVALLPTEVRCSYPSKLCNNHRAVKDNGDLHKLCDFHRKKANVNQQRMQQKRRLIRQQMMERKKRFMDAAQAPMEYNAVTDTMEPKEPICNLSHEEVMMLEAMLFDDEDGEGYASPGDDSAYATGYAMSTSGMSSNMSL